MNTAPPFRILHVITGLQMGGAEMALYGLLSRLESDEFQCTVAVLTDDGPVGEMIRDLGVPVMLLGLRRTVPDPRAVLGLMSLVRRLRPNLIQTWMYHADLAGGLAARLAGSPPVVWGVHHTVTRHNALKPATYAIARLNAVLSHVLPVKIICCAESARQTHITLGYEAERMTVIPNGFDLERFKPDPAARRDVRREVGLRSTDILIGMGARFDPQKDHENFIRAAAILHHQVENLHFMLWGKGIEPSNPALSELIGQHGLDSSFHLLGLRADSHRLFAALDIASLSSAYGEAFPLVIGEAMACEVPCAATDVGDAAYIVGNTGRILPPRDSNALAGAWRELLQIPAAERRRLGKSARLRVMEHFSLEQMVSSYTRLYQDIINRTQPR